MSAAHSSSPHPEVGAHAHESHHPLAPPPLIISPAHGVSLSTPHFSTPAGTSPGGHHARHGHGHGHGHAHVLDAALQPPQVRLSPTGAASLPSFPLYCRRVLRAARVHLSPASASLLHYALFFTFRRDAPKTMHLLHLLYTKLLYVRIREEGRRRAAQAQAQAQAQEQAQEQDGHAKADTSHTPAVAHCSPIVQQPHPVTISPMASPSEHELAQRLHAMPLGPCALKPRTPRPPTRNASRSTPDEAHALSVPAAGANVFPSPPIVRSPSSLHSCMSRLGAAGSTALAFPFSLFAAQFSQFADRCAVAYCSVCWDQLALFLRANAEPRCQQDTIANATQHPSRRTMMDLQTALVSSLDPVPSAKQYAAAADGADELAVLNILRSDADLNHYPIDWAGLLMLTHDAYRQSLAAMEKAQEQATAALATSAQITVGHSDDHQSHHLFSSHATAASGAYTQVPLVTPPAMDSSASSLPSPSPSPPAASTSAALHSPSISSVVMSALSMWRAEKRAQRKEERRIVQARNREKAEAQAAADAAAGATGSSDAVAAPLAASSSSSSSSDGASTDLSMDICYVPLTAKHRLDRNTSEQASPDATAPTDNEGSPTHTPHAAHTSITKHAHQPLSAARRRWKMVKAEMHKQRLLRLLRTQREFYLSLAKYKVLTHRATPALSKRASANNLQAFSPGQQQHRSHAMRAAHSALHSASMSNMQQPHSRSAHLESDASTPSHAPSDESKSPIRTMSPIASSPAVTADEEVDEEVKEASQGRHGGRSGSSECDDAATAATAASSPSACCGHASPPRRPLLILMGGGMSSGKSTVLAALRGSGSLFGACGGCTDDAVLVEADKFKEVDPLYQLLPPSDPARSVLVHSQSLATAEETLLAAVRAGRDVIVDGTMSWRPYVEQTISMVRQAHVKEFARGPGFQVNGSTGEVKEEYWVERRDVPHKHTRGQRVMDAAIAGVPFTFSPSPNSDDEKEHHEYDEKHSTCSPSIPPPPRLPYIVCMLGVTVAWPIAVCRAIRRAVSTGRGVPIPALLNSYSLFASNFDAYAHLVDGLMLWENSADAGGALLQGQGATQPTLIAARALDDTQMRILQPELWGAFRRQATMPAGATCADDMFAQQKQRAEEAARKASEAGVASDSASHTAPVPPPSWSGSDVLPLTPSLPTISPSLDHPSRVYPSLGRVVPSGLRWLLAQRGGDDDIITDDDDDDEQDE